MQILERTEHLVDQVGQSFVVEFEVNDLAQVRLNVLHDQVEIVPIRFDRVGEDDVCCAGLAVFLVIDG